MNGKGKFIVFEGGDGCGKTTHLKLLEEYLKSEGYKIFSTKEPGGTQAGQLIREKILLTPTVEKNPITELLLFEACRSEFAEKIIKPTLEDGYNVLSDRFYYATKAYQGYGRGLDTGLIDYFNNIAAQGINPDLVIIIDIDAKKGLEKVTTDEFGKKDWFEKENLEFHERVNEGYRKIAENDTKKIKLIPYIEGGIDEMQLMIRKYAKEILNNKEKE